MCAYLESTQEDVSAVSFNHRLKRVSQTVVEKSNSLEIVARQAESRKEESKLADDILKAGKELKKLEKEGEPSLLHPVKYSAIGFMAGFFLSCLYLLISFIGKGMVYSSSYMAERFGLTYFGSLNRKEKLFLHEKILSEKLWNKNDAAVFISENVKNRITEGSKVLVMSSGSVCKEDEKAIADCLLKQKMVLSFVQSAQTNSETVGKVKDCDCVILLEKTWTAGRRDVEQSVILAQKFEKPVSGFVTILD
ncbi:MAG: hypothetical protein MJ052_05370 [Sphaerochaetaceae bacterium]|nr:hypothetical protein [Sphaerochaetaceae bacterium]